ncbi:MAG: redoxin domain-containing protein [Planctomycetota bacterium]
MMNRQPAEIRSLLQRVLGAAALVSCVLAGCTDSGGGNGAASDISPDVVFEDQAETNSQPEQDVFDLSFIEHDGGRVMISDFEGKQNVLLVVTRGYSGFSCPYCSAQTARLIRNQEKFAERNTKVIVVYPGEKDKAVEFVDEVSELAGGSTENTQLSFVLDEDLATVKRLMIEGDLAMPATYILDSEGQVRFAYVGRTASDRPSLKAILEKLDQVNGPGS